MTAHVLPACCPAILNHYLMIPSGASAPASTCTFQPAGVRKDEEGPVLSLYIYFLGAVYNTSAYFLLARTPGDIEERRSSFGATMFFSFF